MARRARRRPADDPATRGHAHTDVRTTKRFIDEAQTFEGAATFGDDLPSLPIEALVDLGRRFKVQGAAEVVGAVGRSNNFPLALPLMLISIASRHCSSGKVRAIGMLNFPAAAACAISPNVS